MISTRTRNRLLLVGQAPGAGLHESQQNVAFRHSTPWHDSGALVWSPGSTGKRLADMLGLSPSEYDETFDRRNLVPLFHGKSGKGDAFVLALKDESVVDAVNSRPAILLGRAVGRVFGLTRFLETKGDLLLIPHPSGVNQWYNSSENRSAMVNAVWSHLNRFSDKENSNDDHHHRARGPASLR